MNNTNSLRDTIEPKSDQFNYDDFIDGPKTMRIEAVTRGKADQPIDIAVSGDRRLFRPCKTMRRVLIAAWGEKGADWVGKSLTLYGDPSVKFGGVEVGGVRISHLSDIPESRSFMLTTTRSKRASYTVHPLTVEVVDYPADEFAKNLPAWVEAIKAGKVDVPTLLRKVSAKGALTTAQREQLEQLVAGDSQ